MKRELLKIRRKKKKKEKKEHLILELKPFEMNVIFFVFVITRNMQVLLTK